MTHRVLVTGAAGYLGSSLVKSLADRAAAHGDPACIVASDVRDVPAGSLPRFEGKARRIVDERRRAP